MIAARIKVRNTEGSSEGVEKEWVQEWSERAGILATMKWEAGRGDPSLCDSMSLARTKWDGSGDEMEHSDPVLALRQA